MTSFESHKVKQTISLAAIILLGGFLLITLSGFISAFLGAIIFYVICSPAVSFTMNRLRFKKSIAIPFVMLLSLLVIVIPVFLLSYLLVTKVSAILTDSAGVYAQIESFSTYVDSKFGVNILSTENITKLQAQLANVLPNLLGQTINILADIAIMYFILFYMLFSATSIQESLIKFLPYKKENTKLFAKELISQTYSNVIGAPLLATIQAFFAALGFWIFGLSEPIFWGIMCGFLSFIPFVGSALIWVPAGISMFAHGASWHGIAILIYGIVIIVNVDNVFRLVIQKKIGDVHPMITVFGVIIGLNWFGLPGIIFGPLLISYFLIMIKLYGAEYGDKSIFDSSTDEDEEK
jgi:predicted PurR-regulated permease PerM